MKMHKKLAQITAIFLAFMTFSSVASAAPGEKLPAPVRTEAFWNAVKDFALALPAALTKKGGGQEFDTKRRNFMGKNWDFYEDAFDIIIVAGQSNARGCGRGEVKEPFTPVETIKMMPQEAILGGHSIVEAEEITDQEEKIGNFGLVFAREYVKKFLKPGRKVLLLQAAVGGTGFLDKHWGLKDDHFQNMLKMIEEAQALNSENRVVALLWHQGESDAWNKATEQQHKENLEIFLKETRKAVKLPEKVKELPFICGDFVQEWLPIAREGGATVDEVRTAMRTVCKNDENAYFIETTGLLSNNEVVKNNDAIHFSRLAIYELGQRYFKAYESSLKVL